LTARSAMVALETALALMLLAGRGLMTESYRRLRAAPLGFEPARLLTFWVRPSEVEYPPRRAPSLIDRVLAEISVVPGVRAGTVGDVAYQSLDERPMQPDFYTPYPQFTYASRAVLVRALGDPSSLVPAVRRAVRRADPSLALYEVRTMEERLGDASAGRRFDTLLLSGFAVVALFLAAMGICAVVAHS